MGTAPTPRRRGPQPAIRTIGLVLTDLSVLRTQNAPRPRLSRPTRPEIVTMTGWLMAWGKPAAPTGGHEA